MTANGAKRTVCFCEAGGEKQTVTSSPPPTSAFARFRTFARDCCSQRKARSNVLKGRFGRRHKPNSRQLHGLISSRPKKLNLPPLGGAEMELQWWIGGGRRIRRFSHLGVAAMEDDNRHYNSEQVSGARQENVVRWVLLASLLLAIIAMSAVWIIPAVSG